MACVGVLKLQQGRNERKIILVEFHKYVINMGKKPCFLIGQLGNMDEVPLDV